MVLNTIYLYMNSGSCSVLDERGDDGPASSAGPNLQLEVVSLVPIPGDSRGGYRPATATGRATGGTRPYTTNQCEGGEVAMRRFVSPRVSAVVAALAIGGAVAASSVIGTASAAASSSRKSTSFNLAAIKRAVAAFQHGPTKYEGPTQAVKVPKTSSWRSSPAPRRSRGAEASLGVKAVAEKLAGR